jgi:hypothetical protein
MAAWGSTESREVLESPSVADDCGLLLLLTLKLDTDKGVLDPSDLAGTMGSVILTCSCVSGSSDVEGAVVHHCMIDTKGYAEVGQLADGTIHRSLYQ